MNNMVNIVSYSYLSAVKVSKKTNKQKQIGLKEDSLYWTQQKEQLPHFLDIICHYYLTTLSYLILNIHMVSSGSFIGGICPLLYINLKSYTWQMLVAPVRDYNGTPGPRELLHINLSSHYTTKRTMQWNVSVLRSVHTSCWKDSFVFI